MDLSRRDAMKLGALAVATPFAVREAEEDYELSDIVEQATGIGDTYDHAVKEMHELDAEAQQSARGGGDLVDRLQMQYLFLGNPNSYSGYDREGIVPDTNGYLEQGAIPAEALRRYAADDPEIPYTSVDFTVLWDDRLDIDLIQVTEGDGATALLEDTVDIVDQTHTAVLPDQYTVTVDYRVEQPTDTVQPMIDDLRAVEQQELLSQLNTAYHDDPATLPVYLLDIDPVDYYSSLLTLSLDDLWTGFSGVSRPGAVATLPSAAIRQDEEMFTRTVVHEIGHAAFDLPHSAAPDDVLSYNHQESGSSPSYGLPSRLLIQRLVESDFAIDTATMDDGTRGIRFQQTPATAPYEQSVDAFFTNVAGYVEGMADNIDLAMDEFESWSYTRRDGDDIGTFEAYKGLDLDMRVRVDGVVESVTPVTEPS